GLLEPLSVAFSSQPHSHSPRPLRQASGIQGAVVRADGRPLQGAEVRIERQDKTSAPVTTQTNAKGSYASSALPAGTYNISVVENGAVKSSVTVKTGESRHGSTSTSNHLARK